MNTTIDKKQVTSLYRSGRNAKQIAEFLVVHTCTVSEFIKNHNIKVRNEKEQMMVMKNEK